MLLTCLRLAEPLVGPHPECCSGAGLTDGSMLGVKPAGQPDGCISPAAELNAPPCRAITA